MTADNAFLVLFLTEYFVLMRLTVMKGAIVLDIL